MFVACNAGQETFPVARDVQRLKPRRVVNRRVNLSVTHGHQQRLTSASKDAADGPLTCTGTVESRRGLTRAADWGSRGRRFKSCHPDGRSRRSLTCGLFFLLMPSGDYPNGYPNQL